MHRGKTVLFFLFSLEKQFLKLMNWWNKSTWIEEKRWVKITKAIINRSWVRNRKARWDERRCSPTPPHVVMRLSVEPSTVTRHNWTTTHEEKAKQTNRKKEILVWRQFFTWSEVFHALGQNNCIFGPQINPDTSASGESFCCSHEAFLGFIRNKSSPHSQITDFWWVSPHP